VLCLKCISSTRFSGDIVLCHILLLSVWVSASVSESCFGKCVSVWVYSFIKERWMKHWLENWWRQYKHIVRVQLPSASRPCLRSDFLPNPTRCNCVALWQGNSVDSPLGSLQRSDWLLYCTSRRYNGWLHSAIRRVDL